MAKIIFKNQPKLSEYEVDKKFNERKLNLIPLIENFLINHTEFKDQEVEVTFSHKGISSLVCILNTSGNMMVLKIPLSITSSGGEALFLKKWEESGVRVPHVFENGHIGEHDYILMEYIDAPSVYDTYTNEELVENKIYFEMGKTLSVMHKPNADGYGRVINDNPEFNSFKEWLFSDNIQKKITETQKQNLLNEKHGSISRACEILINYIGNKKSNYCHDDFGTTNLFATRPITVFDPSPRFNNKYIDIGRSMYSRIGHHIFSEQFLDGYFENEKCDYRVLHASILLNSYLKFPYAFKTNKMEVIKNIQDYLIKNKNLLE